MATESKNNPEMRSVFIVDRPNGIYHLRLYPSGIELLLKLNEKYDNNWTLGEYAQLLLKDYPDLRMIVDYDEGPYVRTNVELLSNLLDVLDEKVKKIPVGMMPSHVACFDEALMSANSCKTLKELQELQGMDKFIYFEKN